MFIVIILVTVLLTWKYGDWRNWQKYQATMLLFAFGNLVYNFVYHDHFLWRLKEDFFNYHVLELILTFTVFPLTALLFLSHFPEGIKKQLFRITKFILIYVTVEFLLLKSGRIEYNYGWNFWWSLAWNCIMFPMLAVHNKKPLLAYFFGVILIFLMNWLFPFKLD